MARGTGNRRLDRVRVRRDHIRRGSRVRPHGPRGPRWRLSARSSRREMAAVRGLLPGRGETLVWPWEFSGPEPGLGHSSHGLFTRSDACHWHLSLPSLFIRYGDPLGPNRLQSLGVVHADDLVDPADEGGHLDVDARHVLTPTAEAPGYQAWYRKR